MEPNLSKTFNMCSKKLCVKLLDFRKEYKDMSPLSPLNGPLLSRLAKRKNPNDESIYFDEKRRKENYRSTHRKKYISSDDDDSSEDDKPPTLQEKSISFDEKRRKDYRPTQQKKYISSDDDDSSEDNKPPTLQEKGPRKTKFQEEVEKNREERLALLKSLEIVQAKENLLDVVASAKPKVKQEPPKSQLITRSNPEKEFLCIPFKNASAKIYDKSLKDVNIEKLKIKEHEFLNYDHGVISQLNVENPSLCRAVISREIASLTWCPNPENMVLAVGSRNGIICMWNIESETNPNIFNPSLGPITHLQFNPWDPAQLVISYNEQIDSADMVNHVFKKIYSLPFSKQDSFLNFDYISKSTYIAATYKGYVYIFDERTNKLEENSRMVTHLTYDCNLGTNRFINVSVHPMKRNMFITTSNTRKLSLWDLRMLRQDPVSRFGPDLVQSAYFSPVTGNSILALGKDTINLFDCQDFSNISCKNQQKYGCIVNTNYENSYRQCSSRAMWLPNSEKYFAFSSADSIHVCDDNIQIVKSLKRKQEQFLNINAFHPFQPAIAVGISFTKVAVFK